MYSSCKCNFLPSTWLRYRVNDHNIVCVYELAGFSATTYERIAMANKEPKSSHLNDRVLVNTCCASTF